MTKTVGTFCSALLPLHSAVKRPRPFETVRSASTRIENGTGTWPLVALNTFG